MVSEWLASDTPRGVRPAREVSTALTGAHSAAPTGTDSRLPHAGLQIFRTNLHPQQLLGFSPPVSDPRKVVYHTTGCGTTAENTVRAEQRGLA